MSPMKRQKYKIIKDSRHTALVLAVIFGVISLVSAQPVAARPYPEVPTVRGMSAPASAVARSGINQLVPPFAIIATPSSPSPGESVTIETQTASFDSNRSNFIWTVDGESRPDLSGLGKNSFTFIAGEVGSVKDIGVRAEPLDGASLSASLAVYTSDVAITWTADTYRPKWYKGKALPVPKSTVRLVAIPTFIIDGSAIPAEQLVYTWDVNGQRMLRGAGKQVLEFQEPEQAWDTPTIVLTVQDLSRQLEKEARAMIVSKQPQAVIYQSLPLGGVEFRRGTTSFPATAPSIIDLQVEPFFFRRTSRHDLSYEWSVQGSVASSSPQNPFILTLDMQQQQAPDEIPISVTVQDPVPDTDLYFPMATGLLNIPIRK